MNVQETKQILDQHGFKVQEEKRLPNDTGWQLRLYTGQVVNIFDKGTFNVQGKNPDAVKKVLERFDVPTESVFKATEMNRSVFVVYGHDQVARTQLEAMLRRWGLEPLILDQLPSQGHTIIEKLETCAQNVNFGVVLATPDDEGHRAGHPDEKAYRARQNVVLELGMLLAKLGRRRVAILLKQVENMERPSDIQGLIYIPFKDDLEKEAGVMLAKEMASQGIKIDVERL
ncbi:TIR domain-containing protein [Neomoorella thermoacetica]|uniref:TIR domain-containing protein n=1 Tax=Neomoorella thermoacetica TaxID=1525 RepID=UPI0030CD6F56